MATEILLKVFKINKHHENQLKIVIPFTIKQINKHENVENKEVMVDFLTKICEKNRVAIKIMVEHVEELLKEKKNLVMGKYIVV